MKHLNGSFGIGVYHIKTPVNLGTLVRSATAFGASFVFTIGKRYKNQSSAVKTERHMPIFHYHDIADWKDHLPINSHVILVEISDTATPLESLKHPKNAVYLLGAEDSGLPLDKLKPFPVIQLPGRICLNVASAGTVVMYDRIAKLESSQ